ncbi:UNVERIFIED_CONTAM: Anthocyanidin 3-O-glucoside 6''-O-acyltransferase [Sesamum calycinum]|uniref:Anthocyanidin 3-O-glucoside 6''-O-acyltransferase n=1 Tax=Sesamum calycinum TaxID=2727403 RepID=A0AAW2M9K4_9LAMI
MPKKFLCSPHLSPYRPIGSALHISKQSAIKKLKDAILSRNPGLVHTSSFVVMAAHIWTCLVRSLAAGEEERADDDGDELQTFLFPVDSRARLDPPVPGNYFGNCLSYGMVRIRHQDLVGNEGFFLAAESIADVIKNRVNDKEKIFAGAENWLTEVGPVTQSCFFAVSGSARVDLYHGQGEKAGNIVDRWREICNVVV